MQWNFTRYHWVGLVVPLLAALSTALWAHLPLQREVLALIAGAATALVAMAVFRFVPGLKEGPTFMGKAVLLGALVTHMTVFHATKSVPPASSIALFMFLYLFAAEVADGKKH